MGGAKSSKSKGSQDQQQGKGGDSKGAKEGDEQQSKGAKEPKESKGNDQEQQESGNAKGKEGHKSYSNGNAKVPGLASNAVEEEVEQEIVNDSMNWMEFVAAGAIGIVVTAIAVALVMRTKKKAAAEKTEMEMGTVAHVPDVSTSEAAVEVTA